MEITLQRVEDAAPDQASLTAARKLLKPAKWPEFHIDAAGDLLWGACQGSGAQPYRMAVALHESGAYAWEEFRQTLIRQVAAAEARGGEFAYYEVWLATFEELLARKGLITPQELEETTYQFEFGERDEVY